MDRNKTAPPEKRLPHCRRPLVSWVKNSVPGKGGFNGNPRKNTGDEQENILGRGGFNRTPEKKPGDENKKTKNTREDLMETLDKKQRPRSLRGGVGGKAKRGALPFTGRVARAHLALPRLAIDPGVGGRRIDPQEDVDHDRPRSHSTLKRPDQRRELQHLQQCHQPVVQSERAGGWGGGSARQTSQKVRFQGRHMLG